MFANPSFILISNSIKKKDYQSHQQKEKSEILHIKRNRQHSKWYNVIFFLDFGLYFVK
jgi:hypothetical protein